MSRRDSPSPRLTLNKHDVEVDLEASRLSGSASDHARPSTFTPTGSRVFWLFNQKVLERAGNNAAAGLALAGTPPSTAATTYSQMRRGSAAGGFLADGRATAAHRVGSATQRRPLHARHDFAVANSDPLGGLSVFSPVRSESAAETVPRDEAGEREARTTPLDVRVQQPGSRPGVFSGQSGKPHLKSSAHILDPADVLKRGAPAKSPIVSGSLALPDREVSDCDPGAMKTLAGRASTGDSSILLGPSVWLEIEQPAPPSFPGSSSLTRPSWPQRSWAISSATSTTTTTAASAPSIDQRPKARGPSWGSVLTLQPGTRSKSVRKGGAEAQLGIGSPSSQPARGSVRDLLLAKKTSASDKLPPAGHFSAVLLQSVYDRLYAEHHERMRSQKQTIRSFCDFGEEVQRLVLDHLIAQVKVGCQERGDLLMRTVEGLHTCFPSLHEATEMEKEAIRKWFDETRDRVGAELEKLIKALDEKNRLFQERNRDAANLQSTLQELHDSGAVQEGIGARQRMAGLRADNAALMAQIDALRKQVKAQQQALDEEKAGGLEDRLAAANAKLEKYQKVVNALESKERKIRTSSKFQELRDALSKEKSISERLSADVAAARATASGLETEAARLTAKLEDVLGKSVATQTDDDGKKYTLVEKPKPSLKDAASTVQKKLKFSLKATPFPLAQALKLIHLIYADKIKADAVDDACDNERQNMQEYVDDHFKNRYGLASVSTNAQAKFAATLRKYRSSNAYCDTFGRLWGLFDELDEAACDEYLAVLSVLIEARTRPDQSAVGLRDGLSFMIRISLAVSVMNDHWKGIVEPKYLTAFTARIQAEAVRFRPTASHAAAVSLTSAGPPTGSSGGAGAGESKSGAPSKKRTKKPVIPSSEAYIDQETLMSMFLQERRRVQERMVQCLEFAFKAGDTNSDGVLDIHEFSSIVGYANTSCSLDKLTAMWEAARDPETSRMDPSDFVQVCLEQGILKTAEAKQRLQMPSEDEDVTSDDHFAAIKLTLDSKREDILARIAGVEDSDLKERLSERFEFVDSLITTKSHGHMVTWVALRMLLLEVVKHAAKRTEADVTTGIVFASQIWRKKIGKSKGPQ